MILIPNLTRTFILSLRNTTPKIPQICGIFFLVGSLPKELISLAVLALLAKRAQSYPLITWTHFCRPARDISGTSTCNTSISGEIWGPRSLCRNVWSLGISFHSVKTGPFVEQTGAFVEDRFSSFQINSGTNKYTIYVYWTEIDMWRSIAVFLLYRNDVEMLIFFSPSTTSVGHVKVDATFFWLQYPLHSHAEGDVTVPTFSITESNIWQIFQKLPFCEKTRFFLNLIPGNRILTGIDHRMDGWCPSSK